MNYIEYRFTIAPMLPAREVLIAELAELEFESFVEEDFGLLAYVLAPGPDDEAINALMALNIDDVQIGFDRREVPKENWNAKWEADFQPICVDDTVVVKAPFHTNVPPAKFTLVIQPKMSFGTGHHDTTWLILQHMNTLDFTGKTVLDMGSGTGILAIMAEKLGARAIDAIDIDDWAEENARENAELNNCSVIATYTGDAALLKEQRYDIILANINRNVLMADLPSYDAVLQPGGQIILSGFFGSDAPILISRLEELGFVPKAKHQRNDWCMLRAEKATK
jgi:ribosomal protein L11 methyltransferase